MSNMYHSPKNSLQVFSENHESGTSKQNKQIWFRDLVKIKWHYFEDYLFLRENNIV